MMHVDTPTFEDINLCAVGRALARGRRAGSVVVAGYKEIASLAEAELVLKEAMLAYGHAIEGHCLAATSVRTQRVLNCEGPVAAPMFAWASIADGSEMRVDPTLLGIGAELHFRLGRLFPMGDDDPACLDDIRDAIVSCHVGLQVLGRRFGHGFPMNAWAALADFGQAAHHVRGDQIDNWRRLDFKKLKIELMVDGNVLARGLGGDTLGDPFASVSWLAQHLRQRGLALEAGSFVSTGSCTGLTQLVAGHVYTGRFGGGPNVSVYTN